MSQNNPEIKEDQHIISKFTEDEIQEIHSLTNEFIDLFKEISIIEYKLKALEENHKTLNEKMRKTRDREMALCEKIAEREGVEKEEVIQGAAAYAMSLAQQFINDTKTISEQ
jgi:predicted nuclease with TOPRIM domain